MDVKVLVFNDTQKENANLKSKKEDREEVDSSTIALIDDDNASSCSRSGSSFSIYLGN